MSSILGINVEVNQSLSTLLGKERASRVAQRIQYLVRGKSTKSPLQSKSIFNTGSNGDWWQKFLRNRQYLKVSPKLVVTYQRVPYCVELEAWFTRTGNNMSGGRDILEDTSNTCRLQRPWVVTFLDQMFPCFQRVDPNFPLGVFGTMGNKCARCYQLGIFRVIPTTCFLW